VQHFYTDKGCDSTVTLHLTVNYSAPTTFIFDTICQGNPYSNYGFIVSADSTNTPGIFADTLYTSRVLSGCDSTVILNLTINPVKTTEWSQTVCDSFIWNSSTYYSTGDYVQNFFTTKECDSTVTLHLTVNYSAPTTFIFSTLFVREIPTPDTDFLCRKIVQTFRNFLRYNLHFSSFNRV
jgi:hypothetical protein